MQRSQKETDNATKKIIEIDDTQVRGHLRELVRGSMAAMLKAIHTQGDRSAALKKVGAFVARLKAAQGCLGHRLSSDELNDPLFIETLHLS